jgi:hypothetical protein
MMHMSHSFSPSPSRKGGILPPFIKGRLGGIFLLTNMKGISVIFLIIAMLLIVIIGYVFSYLIPTKQKSVRFPIYSTQAFYIAQSGVEFAVRYASADQGWRGATDNGIYDINRMDGISRPLGNGTFTITYNNAVGDTLTSTGQTTGSSENRVVRVSNFSPFLRLLFVTSPWPYRNPYWSTGTSRARFYIRNVRSTNVILNSFSASWTQNNPQRRISRVYIGGTEKYRGNYNSGSGIANFNRPPAGPFTYTLTPGTVYLVEIRWNNNVNNGRYIFITFYSTAGDGYAFNLDSAGNGL